MQSRTKQPHANITFVLPSITHRPSTYTYIVLSNLRLLAIQGRNKVFYLLETHLIHLGYYIDQIDFPLICSALFSLTSTLFLIQWVPS